MSDLSDRLQQARNARGLSARALSLSSGLTDSVVGQIERGEIRSPRSDVVVALAKALDVDAGWLLAGEGRGPAEAPAEVA